MNYFEVYAERELFEYIISDEASFPNWSNIIANHSTSYLNLSEEEIDRIKENPGDDLLHAFINAYGINSVFSDLNLLNTIESNYSSIESKPFSAFFINKENNIIEFLSKKFGLIFQNNDIDDNILSDIFFKDLDQNEKYKEDDSLHGWQFLMKDISKNFNSMVLTDPYLFDLPESINGEKVKTGVINTVNFLDSVLPLTLQVDFHLLLVTGNNKNSMTNEKAINIYKELREKILYLRPYNIIFEFIECPDTIHRRRAYTNYVVYKCDQGFDVFSEKHPASPKTDNDLTAVDIFSLDKENKNDPHLKEIYSKGLKIKTGINKALKNIKENTAFKGQKCFGFDDTYTIKNRLLNYFP